MEVTTWKGFPTTEPAITAAAQDAIDAVVKGEQSAVETYVKIKAMQMYLDTIEKGIKDAFVDEVDRCYDCKVDRPLGATLKATTSARRWDYSASADHEAYEQELKAVKIDMQALEKKMQLDGSAVLVGGGTTTYSVTLAKQ